MLKHAFILAIFVAYANSVSEKTYGLASIRGILSFYQYRINAVENEFGVNIDKFLESVGKTAEAISATVGSCVRTAAVPVEATLFEESKKVLVELADKIAAQLQKLDDLNEDEIDKLWTSVSLSGNFRTDMNTAVMNLKRQILQRLNQFKQEIIEKCNPKTNVVSMDLGRRFG